MGEVTFSDRCGTEGEPMSKPIPAIKESAEELKQL